MGDLGDRYCSECQDLMTNGDRGLLMGLEGGGDRLEWICLCEYDKVEDFLYNQIRLG